MEPLKVRIQPAPVVTRSSRPQEKPVAPPKPSNGETKVIKAPKESEPAVKKIGDIEKGVARSVFDSVFRGVIRYFESLIDSQPLRVLYRVGTESVRKTSEIAFLNVLDNKKTLSLNDLARGSMRALEHLPATVAVEPSFFEGSIPRALAGLGNMAVRFAARFGFYKINATSREALGEKNLLDEFTSRSLARVIPVNFDNPTAGIGMRILEQLAIDLNLHVFKPLSRLFPQFGNSVSIGKNKNIGVVEPRLDISA